MTSGTEASPFPLKPRLRKAGLLYWYPLINAHDHLT